MRCPHVWTPENATPTNETAMNDSAGAEEFGTFRHSKALCQGGVYQRRHEAGGLLGCERFAKRGSNGGGGPRTKVRIISGVILPRRGSLWRFRNGVGGQRRPQRRREYLGHQQTLRCEAEFGTSCPQQCVGGDAECLDGAPMQLVSSVDRLAEKRRAGKSGMPEQHAAERAGSQSRKPARQRAARMHGQHRVGEDEWLAVDRQDNLANPGSLSPAQSEQCRFVGRGGREPLRHDAQRKLAETLQSRGQRAVVKQPVP